MFLGWSGLSNGYIAVDWRVEGGYVAYDPALDRLHRLNPIAALLTELCDGSRNVEEISDLVGPLMPEGGVTEIGRFKAHNKITSAALRAIE